MKGTAMPRRATLLAALVVGLLSITPAAHAKGPAGAVIEGDGVSGALVIDKPGELGQGTPMSQLVEAVGFFELTFGESAKISKTQPTKAIGKSRIVITWDMTGGDTIVQEIYHHAEGGPVTYIEPGQEFWEDTAVVVGGWFTITKDIATPLTALGVDESAVSHLLTKSAAAKSTVGEAADPVKSTEPAKTATKSGDADAAAATGAAKTPAAAETTPGNNNPAAPPAATSSDISLILGAAVLFAAIIGAGAWMRQRRPMPR